MCDEKKLVKNDSKRLISTPIETEPFPKYLPVIGKTSIGYVRGFYMHGKYIIDAPFIKNGKTIMKSIECESIVVDFEYIRNIT